MNTTLSPQSLDQLFRTARSHNGWLDRDIPVEQLEQLYDLLKQGPTSNNCCPARFVFVRSAAAKQRRDEELAEKARIAEEKANVPPPPSDEEKARWILNYTRALQQETAELIDSVPWKWWAKYQKFDEQNAKVEVVDLFHFLVSLAQTLGMTADDVYQAYLKKNQVNHQRQDSGYVKKDEADSKHI